MSMLTYHFESPTTHYRADNTCMTILKSTFTAPLVEFYILEINTGGTCYQNKR